MAGSLLAAYDARPRQPELRQRDVVVELLEHHLHAAADLRLGVRRIQQVAGHQRAGRVVELDDDARVGMAEANRLSPAWYMIV